MLVHTVHFGKVVHVCDENGGLISHYQHVSCFDYCIWSTHLEDLAQAAAGFLENGFGTLTACLGLVGDAALDQITRFV